MFKGIYVGESVKRKTAAEKSGLPTFAARLPRLLDKKIPGFA